MAKILASRTDEMSRREQANLQAVRGIAAQGMVLLENSGVLPLREKGKIALFGSGARRTIKGGTGSGDVNSKLVINVAQGLKEAGFEITTDRWLDEHDRLCEESWAAHNKWMKDLVAEKGMAALGEIFETRYLDPDGPEISPEDIAASDTDTAVYVLSRNSGEGSDRSAGRGDFELSEMEEKQLRTISGAYAKTVVVLNVGGVIDTKFFRNQPGIGALLLMSQGGCASGQALADILTGEETPSGHLAMTWAENYADYPYAAEFSHMNGNLDDEYYREGIFVGYRYFDTFNVKPAYPFGYGLSYTSFTLSEEEVSYTDGKIRVTVTVTNTEETWDGREVVQVYASSPAGKLEKPYQALVAFAKTELLSPGHSERMTLSFDPASMASYDEGTASYILEKGEYLIRVGTSSRNTRVAGVLTLAEDKVTERLTNRLALDTEMEPLSRAGITPWSYPEEAEEIRRAPRIPFSAFPREEWSESGATGFPLRAGRFSDVREGKLSLDDFIAQLSDEDLALLCVGTARRGAGGTPMIGDSSTLCPGAAGDTTFSLYESFGIPSIVLADGPAGLRLARSFVCDADGRVIPGLGESGLGFWSMLQPEKPERPSDAVDYYQNCTAIPIATLLAQTWDMDLVEAAGDIVGGEMEEYGVTLWLAPGMNIQRNPLCGRNFEYYSEDPLLAGKCAAADTTGVQQHPGCGTTIKHFALNNQEDNRAHTNAHCTERAIREIYLKGFEIAVRESAPMSVMTSYNLLNGIHTANSRDLLNGILKKEWGYQGVVMTDWGTTGNGGSPAEQNQKYGSSSPSGCIKAGNDLIMPGSQYDVDDILAARKGEGDFPLSREELEACAKRVVRAALLSAIS